MITSLARLSDIAREFGTSLSAKGRLSWFYANQNPESPVRPVMAGGRIKQWVGYDHSAQSSFLDVYPLEETLEYHGMLQDGSIGWASVMSSSEWYPSTTSSWLLLVPQISPGGDGFSGSLEFWADENLLSSNRTGVIIIENSNGLTASITVEQLGV